MLLLRSQRGQRNPIEQHQYCDLRVVLVLPGMLVGWKYAPISTMHHHLSTDPSSILNPQQKNGPNRLLTLQVSGQTIRSKWGQWPFFLGQSSLFWGENQKPAGPCPSIQFSPNTWGRSNSGDLRVCIRAKPWDRQENKDLMDVRPQQMSSTSGTNEREFMPDWATEGRAEKTSTPKTWQFVGVYVVICSV